MASERDLELLDQYVTNRLPMQERAAFEKKLDADSSLKSEYQFQQKMVEKIREARVKELKTMFNNVPASALEPGGTSMVTQVVLWVAVVGAVGTGVYLFTKDDTKVADQPLTKQEEVITEQPKATDTETETPAQQEAPATPQSDVKTETTAPVEPKQEQNSVAKPQNGAKTEETVKSPAPLDVFDPTEETDKTNDGKPEDKIAESSPLTKSSIVVETNSNHKKYNFHYQVKAGKLYLYGPFESNLYEIMEFFSGNKRTMFLYYKDSYYLLSEENETIKPLAAINDPALVKKLKDYRGNR
jgi:hypothetical protein